MLCNKPSNCSLSFRKIALFGRLWKIAAQYFGFTTIRVKFIHINCFISRQIGGGLSCLLFGSCDALQLRLQFSHPQIPYQIFTMLAYVASILALIGIVGKANPPSSAGIPQEMTKWKTWMQQ